MGGESSRFGEQSLPKRVSAYGNLVGRFIEALMKKLTFVLVAAFAVTSFAFSQAAGPKTGSGSTQKGSVQGKPGQGGMRRGGGMFGNPKMFEEVAKKLNLTADQKTKLQKVQKDFQAKMEAMRPKNAKNGERPKLTDDQRKKFMATFEDYQKKVNAILTPAQQKKLKEIREEAMKKFRGGPGGPGGPRPGGPGGQGGPKKP